MTKLTSKAAREHQRYLAAVKDAAAKAQRKTLDVAKRLLSSAFGGKDTATNPHHGAALSSEDDGKNVRQPATRERDLMSDVGTESGESDSRNTRVSLFPLLIQTTTRTTSSGLGARSSSTTKTSSKAATKHSRSEVAPTRQSKRLKQNSSTQPPKATSPMPNAKSFCVTPSTNSASQVDPPVSGSSSGDTTALRPSEGSTSMKRNPSETMDGIIQVWEARGRKKPRRAQKDLVEQSGDARVASPENVSAIDSPTSLTQSDTSSNFVSPPTKTARSSGKGRSRTYGKKRRASSTSLDDDFAFLSGTRGDTI